MNININIQEHLRGELSYQGIPAICKATKQCGGGLQELNKKGYQPP